MQERKQYKISLPMTEKQKNKVEELLKFASFDGIPFRLEEIEKSKEVQEEKQWPQDNDLYYYIVSDGINIDNNYFTSGGLISEHRLAVGNCFKTKEEAEFELERLKVLAEMKKFAESEDRKWDKLNRHWMIYFDTSLDAIVCDFYVIDKFDCIYFESEEKAKECVETIGAERIKKFYLMIKE